MVFADEAIAASYRRSCEEAMSQGITGMVADAAALVAPWPIPIDSIRCPVRLWHGDRDANAPIGMGRWLAHHLPQGELREWPGTGHFGLFAHWREILDDLSDG